MSYTLKQKPFSWNDNFSETALEDFALIRNSLSYNTSQTIGTALAKLKLLEEQGCKIDEQMINKTRFNLIQRSDDVRTKWTTYEESYLLKKYLHQPVSKTAYSLNRTQSSVKHKAARMGLNHYKDSFNAKTLANCFNVDFSVVKRWIEKFNLPCKKVICSTQTRYLIDTKEFWKWADKNRNIINWSKYEKSSVAPEPIWVKDEMKNYKETKSRARFTEQEIITIKGMLRRGLSYKEIASQMGRSYNSINQLCRKIYS